MERKRSVMLVILVDAEDLQWFVSAVDMDGSLMRLFRSEKGDLEKYRQLDFDEQVAFLRHRFCGVLQRGCDRIWSLERKASQFLILFRGAFADPTGRLMETFAEHLTQWLLNPPLAVFRDLGDYQPTVLVPLAGRLVVPFDGLLSARLDEIRSSCRESSGWEIVPTKK